MARVNKETEEQLEQMLWSPNNETSGSKDSKKQKTKRNLGGKNKTAQKYSGEVPAQKHSSPVKGITPKKILERKDNKRVDSKTLPSDITPGPKEDIGQPIDRASSSSKPNKEEGKPETNATERKKPKKKKTPKKPKVKKKGEAVPSPNADPNKTVNQENIAGMNCLPNYKHMSSFN